MRIVKLKQCYFNVFLLFIYFFTYQVNVFFFFFFFYFYVFISSVLFFFFFHFFFSLIENYLISIHVFPILNPPPSSLSTPSLWVIPVHQPQASSIVHWTWTGISFHTWRFTCFNAILPNLPTLLLPIRVKDLKHHFLQIMKHFISCADLNGSMFIFCSVYIILKVLFYLFGFFYFFFSILEVML